MATDDEAAGHLFISRRAIVELRAKGTLPAAGSTLDQFREAYIFNLREAAAGRVATAEKSELDAQRARAASEQADQMAMKNAIMRREYAPLGLIRDAFIGAIEVVKTKLKRVPARVAPSDQALKGRIADAIEDALIDLSIERIVVVEEGFDEAASDADDD